MEGFRDRLDREIAAFLAAKRAAAALPGGEPAGVRGATASSTAGQRPDEVAAGLPEDLAGEPSRDLIDGVGRLITQGGKRLRPALVFYSYRACGGRSDGQVLPLALAVELLHTYLLIHDDIMDHAEVRRGQPTAHVRFGELHRARGLRGDAGDFGRSVAILLGDLAHTYAVELFTRVAPRPGIAAPPAEGGTASPAPRAISPAPPAAPAPHWVELNRCFSLMCEEVITGQYLEYLLAHRRCSERPAGGPPAPREADLLHVLRLKSGRYTAERPIQLGALLAGAPAEVRGELSRYGTAVGEAFQLQDDLLGMFGDPATVGKPVGDDLREGKFTLLVHHALVNGSAADRQRVASALGDPDLSADAVAQVQETLERTGARRAVTAMIEARLTAARHALEKLQAAPPAGPRPSPAEHPVDSSGGPEAEGMRFLAGLLDYLREREQ